MQSSSAAPEGLGLKPLWALAAAAESSMTEIFCLFFLPVFWIIRLVVPTIRPCSVACASVMSDDDPYQEGWERLKNAMPIPSLYHTVLMSALVSLHNGSSEIAITDNWEAACL